MAVQRRQYESIGYESGFGGLVFGSDEICVKGDGLMWATVEHHLMVVDHQCAVDRIFRACDQFRVMRGEYHLLVVTEQGLRHMRGRHLIQTLGRLVGNDRCGREAQCGSNRQQMALLAIQ